MDSHVKETAHTRAAARLNLLWLSQLIDTNGKRTRDGARQRGAALLVSLVALFRRGC
jgi:hypothetical protein